MAVLIASGTSELASDPFTLTAGVEATVYLTGIDDVTNRPEARVQIQGADLGWTTIAILNKDNSLYVISAVGTFRVFRSANAVAFSVDKN